MQIKKDPHSTDPFAERYIAAMTDIFEFTDFREYLRTYFEEKKKDNPRFSYQLLTQKAGFNNRGFLFNIIKGKKKLTKTHCFQLSQALGHKKKEASYFETLVAYAQAKNEQERTYYLEQIEQNRTNQTIAPQLIGKNQFEFYTKWYHSAVRALIGIIPFSGNFEMLTRLIFPPITSQQAQRSVELLERLELIAKGKDGVYRLTGKSIQASDDISQLALNRFHIECTELAKQSLIYSNAELRFKSSITLGISSETFNEIVEETCRFRAKIVELANNDNKADRVYQYQLVFFPLSNVAVHDDIGGHE